MWGKGKLLEMKSTAKQTANWRKKGGFGNWNFRRKLNENSLDSLQIEEGLDSFLLLHQIWSTVRKGRLLEFLLSEFEVFEIKYKYKVKNAQKIWSIYIQFLIFF